MQNFLLKSNPVFASLTASLVAVALLVFSFLAFEPVVSHAVTDQFTVSQTITAEIAFAATSTDVSMEGSIASQTGGSATGQAQVRVRTNNAQGYSMTVDFASSSYGTAAMNQNGGSGYINDYTSASSTNPDYAAAPIAQAYAQFAYTVNASTTSDLDLSFRNNGSSCGDNGGGDVAERCWFGPSTSPETIIYRQTPTPDSGATTTLYFYVTVPSNPSPAVPAGTYTATTTLTAVTN